MEARPNKLRTFSLVSLALLAAALVALTGCRETAQKTIPISVGGPAPAFTLPSAAGRDVSLSQYLGKSNVLLYFHMAYG